MKHFRVLIVDDSSIFRGVLQSVLESEGDIKVVGQAGSGEAAVRLAANVAPDLITIDIAMPGLNGLETIEQIMATRPVPILVLTARPVAVAQGSTKFEAIRRGALEILEKGAVALSGAGGPELRALVRRLAGVRVVRHVTAAALPLLPKYGAPADLHELPALAPATGGNRRLVALGASAGGPAVVAAILAQLDATFPASVAVVQHLPLGFSRSFADFLQHNTRMSVKLVTGEVTMQPGQVYVAPDDRHLVATSQNLLDIAADPPILGFRPAVNALFHSVADAVGAQAVGVVLSGIGEDGAVGLREMHQAGALTIAQDEESSAVYGMPRAAVDAGGVRHIVGAAEIPELLKRAVQGGRDLKPDRAPERSQA